MALLHPEQLTTSAGAAGQRLDQFLAAHLDVSRARVQQLIVQEKILLNGTPPKASYKLSGGEQITILGPAERPPLRAIAEDIPLDIVYEDGDLAIVNKPAGMMVHAGAGATGPNGEDQRNRGTLVNALLHHFASLSAVGGEMRPGIVHRLDKETSGLIVVAKKDDTHRKLAAQFARRAVKKTYVALVHRWPKNDSGTISAAISRDRVRRTRMTTRVAGGREAVSHYRVVRRIEGPYGKFALTEVKIDTGRTHQIRVHMASIGHPVVGDKLYGAPAEIAKATIHLAKKRRDSAATPAETPTPETRPLPGKISLSRNFLHAAGLELTHPRSGEKIARQSPLPPELVDFLHLVEAG
jgi:23S rRNA pseudouridine1911/1915/1917 synthase